MKQLLLLIIIIAVVSCKSTKKSGFATDKPFTVENLAGLSAEEIRQKYPNANIRQDVGLFEEGTEERPYSILFPDTPDELHITWADEGRTKMEDIRFTEDGRWSSAEGITIGTTYEQLNEINEKKILFYGFGWDYSGAVDWNGGKLDNSNLRVFLAPEGILKEEHYGDQIVEASPEEIKKMDLRVQTVLYKL